MIEVKIPADIGLIKTPFIKGFTTKEIIYFGMALVTMVPLAFFGNRFMPDDLVGWVVLVLTLVILSPLYIEKRLNSAISGEEYLIDMATFMLNKQTREYVYLDDFAKKVSEGVGNEN